MGTRLSLGGDANLDELRRIQQAVSEFGQAQNWPPELVFQIELVIEEVGVNIVNYAYDDAPDRMEVVVDSANDALTLEFIDNGRAFDPLNDAPPPELEADLEHRPIGGLGVHLVKTMADEAHYRREAGCNHLTLTKRRSL